MSFYKPLSILFYITFLLVLGCKPKEKDLIDMALGELEKYHKIEMPFIIIECAENDIIKVMAETRKRGPGFFGDYRFKISKDKYIDVLVYDNCIDILKFSNKDYEVIKPVTFSLEEATQTGDESLSEFKYVLIKYNIKTREIVSVEKGEPI